MGLFGRLAAKIDGLVLRSGAATQDDPWDSGIWGSGGYTSSSSGVPITSTTAMQQVAVMSCVSILAEDVAKLPVGVFERLPNGGKRPAKGHPLTALLRRPNAWQTRFEFIELMQSSLVLRGNAYAVLLRNGRGVPEQMVPIHPDRVTLYESPGGEIFYFIGRQGMHEIAVLRDMPMMIAAEDMLHVRWLSMWNSLLGVSRIGLMREAIGLAVAQEQHAAHFARQGARPSGIIETEQKLAPDVVTRTINAWKDDAAGFRNSGKTRVLEQGLKWKPMSMTMADADFIASQRLSTEAIARGFRVPLYKIGVPAEGQGSAMVQQDQEYLNNVLDSYCERWTSKLEATFDIDGIETFVEWDYSHFIKADIATRYTAYRQAVGGPFMMVNEARRSEGLPDVAFGDQVQQAGNMVPLGTLPTQPGKAPGSDATGVPGQGGDGDAERLPDEATAPAN